MAVELAIRVWLFVAFAVALVWVLNRAGFFHEEE